MEEQRSLSLLKIIENERLLPSPEEEEKRREILHKLETVVMEWAKRVAWQRRLPTDQIEASSAAILTFGSYGLGVDGPESKVNALCIGPCFTSMADDFFIVLRNMLKSMPEVSEIHCLKDEIVPKMRIEFNGTLVDLSHAQSKVLTVIENLNVFDPSFLINIDETSWKSLSKVRLSHRILQLVPNVENFQSLLRCIKLWAKRRGVHGNLNGFLGDVHLAVLAAYVCQNDPDASLGVLFSSFFGTFAMWPWPTPVVLQDGKPLIDEEAIKVHLFMPIRLPCSPHNYCHSTITKWTFYKIRAEFLRAHKLTKDLLDLNSSWDTIFDHYPYSKKYARFVKIYLSAPNQDELGEWVGRVKSKFLFLLGKLEELQGSCDPNPTEYVDIDMKDPNLIFYWGLNPGKSYIFDVNSVQKDFLGNIFNGYHGICRTVELSIVQACKLPKNIQLDVGIQKKMRTCCRDSNEQRAPVYSQHLPTYLLGYMATDEDIRGPESY